MDGDHHLQNQPPPPAGPSYWNDLLLELKVSILIRLPVSDVVTCATVSRQLLTLVRSPAFITEYSTCQRHPEDIALVVVLFAAQNIALAYHPSRSRWTSFPFPSTVQSLDAFGRTRVYGHDEDLDEEVVVNVFTQEQDSISPVPPSSPPFFMIPMIEEEENSAAYMIVAIKFLPLVAVPMVYDSTDSQWTAKNELYGDYVIISNAVFLNGRLLVLSGFPDRLLTFDPVTGESSVRNVHRPPFWESCQLIVFEMRLFALGVFVGGVGLSRIQIWELDRAGGSYSLHDSMPEDLYMAWMGRLAEDAILVFGVSAWKGMVFFRKSHTLSFVMYDFSTRQWSQLPECDHPAAGNFNPETELDVLALELHPQLLHRYNNCL